MYYKNIYFKASDSTDSVAQAEESGFIKHSIHPALDENDVIEEPTDKSKRSRRPKSKASGADVEPSSRKGSKKRSASKKKSRSRSRSTKRVKKIQWLVILEFKILCFMF